MAVGRVHPLRTDGLDPHAVISFESEPDTVSHATRTGLQPSIQAQDPEFIFEDERYDMRVGDKRKREALLAAATEIRQKPAAAPAAKKARPAGGNKEVAAKPAGPLPKDWRCVRKMHASGQREGQHYKVYLSPANKQYLSYVTAQADFGKHTPAAQQKKKPAAAAASQQRSAEYLPPDWLVISRREGGKTFVGPQGQRISSWHGLMEQLAAAFAIPQPTQPPAQPQGLPQGDQGGAEPGGIDGGAAAVSASVSGADTDMAEVRAWLWSLARAVQHGKCELGAEDRGFAQRVARLRLARSRHD